ncbi:MAG: RagB/SusD family nutrient uptake outer membrane protein [Prolixibacteraceae bacterium]|nr:RagB/SusD family nutrient uptake outer membrane protein [Prolixibacteraceae bacterium]MBT6762906.1 RagB/SusD family nutrient uptake outer membrane protein [Prolixibacteraceae bacterium]MBT6998269.1 RagB/SusD family nutrient uptake outer membrane protein [Prolixibacteraceae bacterium]MBT7393732.1 RagB/SusD family nutrient uptake outer membrane protein [Prolixibacteraceae bacterium]
MKKLSIIMVTVFLLTMSYSCSEEFLTKAPLGSTSENVFYDATGIDALLIGTYAIVPGSSLWDISWGASIQNWTYGSAASDDAYKGSELTDQVPVNDIERWEVQSTNGYPADKYKLGIGMGVDRANKTMKVINATEEAGTITADKANLYKAEARFLRALFYFELRLVFGDYVPILTEETEDPLVVSNANADGAVLTQIITDLEFAWTNLPESQAQVGRPTKYAAMALAARAYLQDLKYAEAKPLLDNIINSGKYSLMPNFIDNFNIATNNNAESIFEIQANVNDINESLNAEMGIGLNWPHGGDIGMCCGFHQPSQNLVNAHKVDENGLPMFDTFNDVDLANDAGISSDETFVPTDHAVDPRLDYTVSRRGIPFKDWGINRGSNWVRKQTEGGPYLPAPKPFFNQSERYSLSTTTGWQTGINANNYRYLRYSHILLWRAEVAASEGDLGRALDLVNQIRDRADNQVVMGKVLITELPTSVYPWGAEGDVDWDQPAANYQLGLYSAFADANEAMTAVQWEQRLEFATEGMRFFDLRRWDGLPNKIGGKSMVDLLNDFAVADLRVRPSFMSGKSFSEGDKYQPIPQAQLDVQPDVLVQRPGY